MLDYSMLNGALSLLLLGGQASATYLYVSSYSGVVSTLNLTQSADGATLDVIATSEECGSSPSWLTLDGSTLYCADEGFATWPNGTLVTYTTNDDGSLEFLDSEQTFVGGVSSVPYGKEGNGLAVAY